MSFELALQKSVYDALTTAGLAVYDDVAQADNAQQKTPYATVGEATHSDWSTDTSSGAECSLIVHTWSSYAGRAEIKQMQADIYAALHRVDLPVLGYALVTVDFEKSDTFLDADGTTRHGVQAFRVLLDS